MSDLIHIPRNWEKKDTYDLLQLDAGRAYIFDQDEPRDVCVIRPEKEIWSEDRQAAFMVYADGSLWFVNNAGDEVWCDVQSFLTENNITELTFDTVDAE